MKSLSVNDYKRMNDTELDSWQNYRCILDVDLEIQMSSRIAQAIRLSFLKKSNKK